ncbi:MAG: site-specific integrase [Eubacteriaceae bacterium]|nr:site-specific integrase [Eubacteriaceae bacterium]
MPAYKDKKAGTWYASCRYVDWTGKRKQKMKRGFPTKREALEWERDFLQMAIGNPEMTFESFFKVYSSDLKNRIRYNTWQTKENIINTHLMPYFGKKRLSDIKTTDVFAWQNELMKYRSQEGKGYSDTYLKTIHNQLSAILNHAVRHYGLKGNAASNAGSIGKKEASEMQFWTKDEYLKFAFVMMDKPISYYAFEVLYWCGLRLGEMLALTPADFDFTNETLSVNKSYQRIKGEDIITDPKTTKSKRTLTIPSFLCGEIQDYLKQLYGIKPDERMFEITKSYLHHEMNRGSKDAGVKRIRVHDLRHSHVSLLIELGFTPLAIADRVGHESIDITYRYAHLFPSKQSEMANRLDAERNDGGGIPWQGEFLTKKEDGEAK